MSLKSLEHRVAELERQVAALRDELSSPLRPPAPDAWKQTIGMFGNDPFMKRVFAEGRKWREAERRKAKAMFAKRRRP